MSTDNETIDEVSGDGGLLDESNATDDDAFDNLFADFDESLGCWFVSISTIELSALVSLVDASASLVEKLSNVGNVAADVDSAVLEPAAKAAAAPECSTVIDAGRLDFVQSIGCGVQILEQVKAAIAGEDGVQDRGARGIEQLNSHAVDSQLVGVECSVLIDVDKHHTGNARPTGWWRTD